MPRYRIFTNDIGPHAYSALRDVVAPTVSEAIAKGWKGRLPTGVKVIACDHEQKQWWPDGKTGKLPYGAGAHVGAK